MISTDPTTSERLTRSAISFLTRLAQQRQRLSSPRARLVLTVLSLVLFAVSFVLAYQNLPPLQDRPVWGILALVGTAGVALSVFWNAMEYTISLRLISHREKLKRTIGISFLAAAANLLPLPGSVLVRGREIYRISRAPSTVILVTATVGTAFLGTAALITGIFLLLAGTASLGVAVVVLAGMLLGGALVLLRYVQPDGSIRYLAALLAVESGSVITKALRYYLILVALHYQPSAEQVFALTLMSVVALATGIFPGGVGGSELLAAAISPLIGLPASVGLITSGIDNLLQFVALALPATVVIALASRRSDPRLA